MICLNGGGGVHKISHTSKNVTPRTCRSHFNSMAPGKFEWHFKYIHVCHFQTDFSDCWWRHLLWNCPILNVTRLHWWSVNIVAVRQQAITWANFDPDLYMSLTIPQCHRPYPCKKVLWNGDLPCALCFLCQYPHKLYITIRKYVEESLHVIRHLQLVRIIIGLDEYGHLQYHRAFNIWSIPFNGGVHNSIGQGYKNGGHPRHVHRKKMVCLMRRPSHEINAVEGFKQNISYRKRMVKL